MVGYCFYLQYLLLQPLVLVVVVVCYVFFWSHKKEKISVFSLSAQVIDLSTIAGGEAEESPAGFGEAPGSL